MHQLSIETKRKRQVVDITDRVNAILREARFEGGAVHAFVLHTTAALTTADLDPGTDQDMLDAFAALIPDLDYRHPHDPSHAPDHILASLIGPSVLAPVEDGALVLGTWQRIVLCELDGPRTRNVAVTLLGGAADTG